ncbi:DNA alkylation repair enzyme [Fragilaria crotonensis]|nr:DNA alkylation repair enzyme [Fragilaria crotonensis]
MGVNQKMIRDMVGLVQTELRKVRNADNAPKIQRYLKTDMPMYGIQRAARFEVEKIMHAHLVVDSFDMYRASIESLWGLPHREEKYLAIDLAIKHRQFIGLEALELFETMIRADYMWWDLCDPISTNLVGRVALQHDLDNHLRRWAQDENMWIRRTAILAQLKHKADTNADLLFDLCQERMHEKEFFVRKAIGWALREYSKTNPELVVSFLRKEKAKLSGLSYREAAKVLVKQGKMKM